MSVLNPVSGLTGLTLSKSLSGLLTSLLLSLQLDFYTRFRAANRDITVSYVAWRRLKPFFVKRLTDFNSCCCRYHQEMQEITTGFMNMRSQKVHVEASESSYGCWCAGLCTNFGPSTTGEGVVSCQVARHRYTPKLNSGALHLSSCFMPCFF